MKPLLKWVGGKTSILEHVFQRFPKDIVNYHELFVGGGSVLLHLLSEHKVTGSVYAYDANLTLISFYRNVQQQPLLVIDNIRQLEETYKSIKGSAVNRSPKTLEEALTSQESFYYWNRAKFNELEDKTSLLASSLFLFLNKTCFRGVYREGPNGFNVPFGHYKNPGILDEEHILQVSKLIEPVIFYHMDFKESLEMVDEGDFMYLDPPYAPENEKSFVSYTKAGFSLEDHQTLFMRCKDSKASFLMSNANVELVTTSFQGYHIDTIECRRAINSSNPAAKADEVLIYNYER